MTETEQQPPESIRAAQITACVRKAISPDKTTAMMVFRIADGSEFAVTCPVEGLAALRSLVIDLCDDAERANLSRGHVAMKRPNNVEIGHSDQIRGSVALMFDKQMATEEAFLLPDEIGLNIADALQKDILGRMSPADREARMRRQRAQFLVPQKTLIVPPGVR